MRRRRIDRIIPLRRLVSWLVDRLLFVVVGAAVLYAVSWVGGSIDALRSQSVSLDLYGFLTVQMPLTLAITYAVWLPLLMRFGPPGRRLTGTDLYHRRGGNANPLRKALRALVKLLLHLTIIGFFVDALVICLDYGERRSIPDRIAGTVVARRR